MPLLAVIAERPGSNDDMKVRMIIELLTPGVEHRRQTRCALPATAGQLEQTLRRGVEEQFVERGLIP